MLMPRLMLHWRRAKNGQISPGISGLLYFYELQIYWPVLSGIKWMPPPCLGSRKMCFRQKLTLLANWLIFSGSMFSTWHKFIPSNLRAYPECGTDWNIAHWKDLCLPSPLSILPRFVQISAPHQPWWEMLWYGNRQKHRCTRRKLSWNYLKLRVYLTGLLIWFVLMVRQLEMLCSNTKILQDCISQVLPVCSVIYGKK